MATWAVATVTYKNLQATLQALDDAGKTIVNIVQKGSFVVVISKG